MLELPPRRRSTVLYGLASMAVLALAGVAVAGSNPSPSWSRGATSRCFEAHDVTPQSTLTIEGLSVRTGEATTFFVAGSGTTPTFVYLVFGESAADTLHIRRELSQTLKATLAHTLVGQNGNVGWIVADARGGAVSPAVKRLLSTCLRPLPAQRPKATLYSFAPTSACLRSLNGFTVTKKDDLWLTGTIASSDRARLTIQTVVEPADIDSGYLMYAVVGSSPVDARARLARTARDVDSYFGYPVGSSGDWSGVRGNVGWVGLERNRSTASGLADAQKQFGLCVPA